MIKNFKTATPCALLWVEPVQLQAMYPQSWPRAKDSGNCVRKLTARALTTPGQSFPGRSHSKGVVQTCCCRHLTIPFLSTLFCSCPFSFQVDSGQP